MDFLFRLAQQNLGVAPAVEPLIPSRFEPGMDPAAPELPLSEEESVAVAPRVQPKTDALPASASAPVPPTTAAPPDPAPSVDLAARVVDEPTMPLQAPGPLEHAVMTLRLQPDSSPLPTIAPVEEPADAPDEASRPIPALVPPLVAPPLPVPLPVVHPRPVQPASTRADVRRREADPPAAPAAIHVTIGRIEVRAAPPPSTPAKRPAPARATPSLGDYLSGNGSSQGGAR